MGHWNRLAATVFLFALYPCTARGQPFIPSEQYSNHIRASGLDTPVMRNAGCVGEKIKLEVQIDQNGRLVKAKEWKSGFSFRRWPVKLVQAAKRLVVRAYRPFKIGGQDKAVRTILEVRCEPPLQPQ